MENRCLKWPLTKDPSSYLEMAKESLRLAPEHVIHLLFGYRLPEVRQGEVSVCDVQVVRWGWRYRVWEFDLHTKYADAGGWGGDLVMLVAGERTLKVNEAERGNPTCIYLPCMGEKWDVLIADVARYTCRITAWKPPRHRRGPWKILDWENEVADDDL